MSQEGRDQADFDNRFAEIIEGFEQDASDGAPDASSTSDEPPNASGQPPNDDHRSSNHRSNPTTNWRDQHPPEDPPAGGPLDDLPSSWRMPSGGFSYLDDDDEEFVPPEPDPLPKDDLQFWTILITLFGGPLWVLYLAIFAPYARTLWWVLAIGTCVAGVVLLVLRQPHSSEFEDDDESPP